MDLYFWFPIPVARCPQLPGMVGPRPFPAIQRRKSAPDSRNRVLGGLRPPSGVLSFERP